MAKNRRNVLIVSAAQCGNVGDDLLSLIAGAIFTFINSDFDVKFAKLEFNRREVEWADIIVIGGGGLIYDDDINNVENYLRFADHAKLMNKKVFFIGVGVQGISSLYGSMRYRETLSKADLILVRDIDDAVRLYDIGVRNTIHVSTDLAFLLPQFFTNIQMVYKNDNFHHCMDDLIDLKTSAHNSGKILVGVSLADERIMPEPHRSRKIQTLQMDINMDIDKAYQTEVKYLRQLSMEKTQQLVFVEQSKDDRLFYEQLCKELKIPKICFTKTGDSVTLLDIYRQFDVVLTSRYHGFIMAILAHKNPYVINGINSDKITRTINHFIPTMKNNIIELDDLHSIQLKTNKLTKQQENDINTTIVKAQEIIEYIKSAIEC